MENDIKLYLGDCQEVLKKLEPNSVDTVISDPPYGLNFMGKKWTFNREEKLERCIFNTTVQSKRFHPTMKDIKVIEKLVRILSNKEDTVLDPFGGSFTSAIACKKLNRKFIGIEINKEYLEIGVQRIKNIRIKK